MYLTCFMIVMCVMASQNNVESVSHYEVVIDATSTVGNLRRIWDNTGLSPPGPGDDAVKYLMSKELFLNIALIGSLPFKAISHIRIHWILDLIKIKIVGGEPVFDFTQLDELLSWLLAHRLRPGFEFMGNPGLVFSDLNSNPNKLVLWQRLVTDVVGYFIGKFGKKEVSTWRFELWNEPDSRQYNILNLNTSGYLNYAKATIRGLKTHGLSVSGPAGTFRDYTHHNVSWGLLQYCNSLISVTGSCGLDTITFHKKGGGNPQRVFSDTDEFYSSATSLYPMLQKLKFANNEADILSGWWRQEKWRGDVRYAAAVCEVLTAFLAKFNQQNFSISYISNDNGFINQIPAYFDQRTLLTRFQMNNSADQHSQFIRKPVMVVMALLSYLGPQEIPVFLRHLGCSLHCNSRLSVLAAGDGAELRPGWSGTVLLAVSGEAISANCSDTTVQLQLKFQPNTELLYVVYILDNVKTNPRHIWEQNGKPEFPSVAVLNDMQIHEGPHVAYQGRILSDWQNISLNVTCPSIAMVLICAKPSKPPAQVLHLRAINITFNEVLLLWQDSDTRCVKTYEVYFRSITSLRDDYKLVSNRDIIMLSYHFRTESDYHASEEATRGSYKIRVRDFWDQCSDFSSVLHYP